MNLVDQILVGVVCIALLICCLSVGGLLFTTMRHLGYGIDFRLCRVRRLHKRTRRGRQYGGRDEDSLYAYDTSL